MSKNEKHITTGVRVTKSLYDKWHELAAELGVSRNQVLSLLLESAKVKSVPLIEVNPVEALENQPTGIARKPRKKLETIP